MSSDISTVYPHTHTFVGEKRQLPTYALHILILYVVNDTYVSLLVEKVLSTM